MDTNYLFLQFVDDISVFFIFTQPIIAISVVVAFILIISLRKKVDTIIATLKKSNTDLPQETDKETKNINMSFDDEIKELDDSINLSKEQREILLFNRFEDWLEKHKYYRKPNFDLNWAAREIGTNRSYLSKAINSQGFGFSEYINKLRIKEVIKILEDENDIKSDYSFTEIASGVGFNSKSVFYNSFHKETGMTPFQFKENLNLFKIENVK